jgi:hypothetical protein
MSKRIIRLFTIIAALSVAWFACGEKATQFILKLNVGDEHRYQVAQNSTTATEFMGRKMEMPSKTDITLTQKVEKVDQGVIDLILTYDSFDMEMTVGGKEIPGTLGEKMVGQSITMKLRENGEIIEPQGIKSMVALQGPSSDVSSMFFSLYPTFPDRALKVGESWTQTQEMDQTQMGVAVETQYTFVRREEKKGYKCAVIDFTTSMSIKGSGEAQMNIEGNGTGKGTMYFAHEKGLLVDSAVELDITMAIAAPLPGGDGKIPTTTQQTITLTLL